MFEQKWFQCRDTVKLLKYLAAEGHKASLNLKVKLWGILI